MDTVSLKSFRTKLAELAPDSFSNTQFLKYKINDLIKLRAVFDIFRQSGHLIYFKKRTPHLLSRMFFP